MLSKAKHFVLPLWFALAAGLCFAADVPAYELPDAADSGSDPNWVLADLDGDNAVDLATTQSSAQDDGGYSHEIRVELGPDRHVSFPLHGLSFQRRRPVIALNSRDVDGDHDRDLVVVESFSGQPLAILLNDGAGLFHEGNLSDYRDALQRSDSSFASPHRADSLIAVADDESPSLSVDRDDTRFDRVEQIGRAHV